MLFKLKRYPILFNLVFYQILSLVMGVGIIIIGYHVVSGAKMSASVGRLKEELTPVLTGKQEQWRAWKHFGLDSALEEDTAEIKRRFALKQLQIVPRSDALGMTDHKSMIVVPNSSQESLNGPFDLVVMAEMDVDHLGSIYRTNDLALYFCIAILVLFLAVIFASGKYIYHRIYLPIFGLNLAFFKMKESGNLETKRIKAFGEIKEFIEFICQMYNKAKTYEQQAAIGRISTQIAHDIRSPLSSMQTALGYLGEMEMADPKAPEVLNLLELSAKRLTGIADGLLKKYKDDVSQNIIFSLHKVLDELVGEFKGQKKYKQVVFIKKYHPQSIELYGESAKLQRAFGNIIKNAMEAMQFSGQIAIETRPEKENAIISIKDNGPGMNEETLNKVLAGGFTKGKEEGHGIGVTVAREVTKQFHGTFWADSETGKGTTFYFQLPLPKTEVLKTAERESQAMKEFVLNVTGKEPIVIIDDEPSMREQWRLQLRDNNLQTLLCESFEDFERQKITPQMSKTAIVDYHFDNSELTGTDIISKLQSLGFQNLYLCTAEYWKPSVQKMAQELGVTLCPKPLPKIVVTPLLCTASVLWRKEGKGEVEAEVEAEGADKYLPHPNPPLTKGREKEGYTVLVVDDDSVIHLSWQMIQKKLNITKLHSFESLEALKKSDGVDFSALDIAFVDKNIENSAFDGSMVIDFLKAKGVSKIVLASGENEDQLRADPQFAKADFVIGMKVPMSFKPFLS